MTLPRAFDAPERPDQSLASKSEQVASVCLAAWQIVQSCDDKSKLLQRVDFPPGWYAVVNRYRR